MTLHPPVIFLDVDGVLNTRPGSLDSDKLDFIRELIAETGCLLVLSSSWRLIERQMARISAELPIWRVTPEIGPWNRGDEVRAFLAANPAVQRFVILDDWGNAGWGNLSRHLLLVPAYLGLCSADLPAIKAIMERKVGE